MRAPLLAAQKDLIDRWGPAAREAELLRKVATQRADKARAEAARAKDDRARDAALAEAIGLDSDADSIAVPPRPRLLAGGDVTPEAIAALLSQHGGRLAVWDAEGGLFDRLGGLYSSGVANLDTVLQAYSSDPISVDRRGREPEEVERPALTLVLMVQPITLARLTEDGDMVGRGFAARFLFALPESLVGQRMTGRAVPRIPATVQAAYAEQLRALTTGLADWTDPAVLELTDGALDVLDAAEARTERRLGPGGDLARTGAWGGKHDGRTVRLAGPLHVAELGPDKGPRTAIDGETMTAAVALGEYYAAHGRAAIAPPAAGIAAARHVLEHLQRHRLDVFTIRQLTSELPRSRFPTAAAVSEAVDDLDARAWVAPVIQPDRKGAGRKPSPRYVVHPAALARPEPA